MGVLLHPTGSRGWGLLGLPHGAVSPGLAMSPTTGLCLVLCVQHGRAAVGTDRCLVKCHQGSCRHDKPRCATLLLCCLLPPGTALSPTLLFPQEAIRHRARVPHHPYGHHTGTPHRGSPNAPRSPSGGMGQHPAPGDREHGRGRCSHSARCCCWYRQVVRERCPCQSPCLHCHTEPSAASTGMLLWPGHRQGLGFCRDYGC